MVERHKMRVKLLQQLRNETLKALSSVIISVFYRTKTKTYGDNKLNIIWYKNTVCQKIKTYGMSHIIYHVVYNTI